MKSTRTRLLAAVYALLALVVLGISACGGGGGGGVIVDPNGVRPVISGISPNSANPGDRLVITGQNFGLSQGASSVVLNGVTFTIDSWSDTEIDVTVPGGVTSGVLQVIVNGLTSQSGSQAQMFVGPAPGGAPVITTLNPNFGRMGTDQITIIGQHFGAAASGQVFFAAQGGTTIQANVVPQTGGTGVQWSDTSIVVYVPATAVSGPLFVQSGTAVSNSISFTALPAPDGLNTPTIDSVTSPDTNIGIGSIVTLTGANFGNKQGGSTITIGGLFMPVINWSIGRIDATVPTGATSGPITVSVGGKSVISDPVTIGNTPGITGVSPSQIKVGGPIDVYGTFFGTTQGTGKLTIGGATVTVATWDDQHIHAAVVPAVTADSKGNLSVVVTSDNGLSSAPFAASISSSLKANITVNPTAGVVGVTDFAFTIEPSGGVGPYSFKLIPDKAAINSVGDSKTASPVVYRYNSGQFSGKQKTFATAIVLTDTSTGESVTLDGPSVLVVGATQPVITKMSVKDFQRGGTNAPNDYMFQSNGPDTFYNRFTFFQNQTTFASYLYQLTFQNNPVANFERNEASYMTGGTHPRGIMYRYNPDLGTETDWSSVVHLEGLNFGGSMGTITLDSGVLTNEILLSDGATILNWTPTGIDFVLPDSKLNLDLSGKILVTTSTNETFLSSDNLFCSAFITAVNPAANVDPAGTVGFSGFDFHPPVEAGVTSTDIYLIWYIKAAFTDPYTGQSKTDFVTVARPMVPDGITPNLLTFDMSRLGTPTNGVTVPVEVFNASHTESKIATDAVQVGAAQYFCYIWTGAITPFSAPASVVANSGMLSEAVPVNTKAFGGGGGGGPLDGSLTPDKTMASVGLDPIITYTYAATGGTAPYKFDLDYGDGNSEPQFTSPPPNGAKPHTYTQASPPPPIGYTVTLVITDSAAPPATVTKTVTVQVTN